MFEMPTLTTCTDNATAAHTFADELSQGVAACQHCTCMLHARGCRLPCSSPPEAAHGLLQRPPQALAFVPLRFLFPQYTIICDLAYKLPIFRASALPTATALQLLMCCRSARARLLEGSADAQSKP